ncbi:MAG: hypothetical protein F6K37_42655, partial [Moorea sp. SIO4E2]|nr:hypothetical protein [Moorena sp. SIO4E2]
MEPEFSTRVSPRFSSSVTSETGVADSGYDAAPLAPQVWGEQNLQSTPKLGVADSGYDAAPLAPQ